MSEEITIAIIGAVAIVIAALIGYFSSSSSKKLELENNQKLINDERKHNVYQELRRKLQNTNGLLLNLLTWTLIRKNSTTEGGVRDTKNQ